VFFCFRADSTYRRAQTPREGNESVWVLRAHRTADFCFWRMGMIRIMKGQQQALEDGWGSPHEQEPRRCPCFRPVIIRRISGKKRFRTAHAHAHSASVEMSNVVIDFSNFFFCLTSVIKRRFSGYYASILGDTAWVHWVGRDMWDVMIAG
jgi:hypothetical protein